MNLLHAIQEKLRSAVTGYVEDIEPVVALVKPTQDPKHGDYQANCAMSLKKVLGKNPREIAQEITDRLPEDPTIEVPQIAGPGFINFRFTSQFLAKQLQQMAADERLGVAKAANPKTVVIDYSSPNVAKPLHVGHLRSTIIGESIARLLRFLGHKVICDNHVGDWGTQFGMILYGYKNFLDKDAYERDPVQELARLYKQVRFLSSKRDPKKEAEKRETVLSDDELAAIAVHNEVAPQHEEAARLETVKLHQGDEENNRLWKEFMPHCMTEIEAIYERLDVHFDYTYGESFYNPMLAAVVEDLKAKGIAVESQGAWVIYFQGNPENQPPGIVQKSDGAFTYMTTDLATIQYRQEEWEPDEILYVVDSRQEMHFSHLFDAADRWGYAKAKLLHVTFGSVLGDDGKPLKTREGSPALLDELLSDAIAYAAKKYSELREEAAATGGDVLEMNDEEKAAMVETVGIGAVKYADLSQNRVTDYKFTLEKMVATTGNTATYMQYAYVRNRGIFRKGNADPAKYRTNPPKVLIEQDAERNLGMALLRFGEALDNATAEYEPSAITSYLWNLAQKYSTFFANCPVLKAETEELRESRLVLCDLTARVIQQGLQLLGIRTSERM